MMSGVEVEFKMCADDALPSIAAMWCSSLGLLVYMIALEVEISEDAGVGIKAVECGMIGWGHC